MPAAAPPSIGACLLTAPEAHRMARAFEIANREAHWHLAQHCAKERLGTVTWLDTRVMLDPRERSEAAIDISRCMLDHALAEGLAVRHPAHTHLVRLVYGAWRDHE